MLKIISPLNITFYVFVRRLRFESRQIFKNKSHLFLNKNSVFITSSNKGENTENNLDVRSDLKSEISEWFLEDPTKKDPGFDHTK